MKITINREESFEILAKNIIAEEEKNKQFTQRTQDNPLPRHTKASFFP
jgi:hypothetical protein